MTVSTPTTADRVLTVLHRVTRANSELSLDSALVADLGFDSLQTLELVAELEDEFSIFIPLNELPDIKTVGEIAARISTLLEEQGKA